MTTTIFHADHGVSLSTIAWALSHINPDGFFMRTLPLPADHAPLMNGLYGPVCGDASCEGESYTKVRDVNDKWRPETPFVSRPKRESNLLTIIGLVEAKHGASRSTLVRRATFGGRKGRAAAKRLASVNVKVFTAYGGPAAHRVPGDPSLVPGTPDHDAAVAFWKEHALSDM